MTPLRNTWQLNDTGHIAEHNEIATRLFNVVDYGAFGNGSHDDTTAIQAAINAANAAGGGEVFLPTGTYKLTASLILKNGVTLRGVYPGASTIQPNYWDLDTVNTGTVITYPGGIALTQDLTGNTYGPQSALHGVKIESLGFNNVETVIRCGGTNIHGLSASVVRDILASNVTGLAFDFVNIMNSHFANLRARCIQGIRVASDNDYSIGTNNDLQPGNSVFTDLYFGIMLGGEALPSFHLQVVPHGGYETNLNLCTFVRVQTNRLYLTGTSSGAHIYLDGATAYAGINCMTLEGLDLEGQAQYHINSNWCNSTKIHTSLLTENNYTAKFRNSSMITLESNNVLKLDIDASNSAIVLVGSMDGLIGSGGKYPLGVYVDRTVNNDALQTHTTTS
jgi:hypothetical protein